MNQYLSNKYTGSLYLCNVIQSRSCRAAYKVITTKYVVLCTRSTEYVLYFNRSLCLIGSPDTKLI